MAETGERLDPTRAVKTPRALKAERTRHRVTFNPSKASPGETLYIAVPRLDKDVVIVPGSLGLRFDLDVGGGQEDNYAVAHTAIALIDRLTVKFAGEVVQDTSRYDLYRLYADLFLTQRQRQSLVLEGIQSIALSKLRSGAANADGSSAGNNAMLAAYGKKYRIPLDHEILTDHGVFYPRALTEALTFEISLAAANQVIRGSDPTKLGYELTNMELEYEVIRDKSLAEGTAALYQSGKMFFYDHVTLYKSFSVAKATDSIINECINVPRRSMKGILLLFVEPYTAGTRNAEKFVNPDIESVKVTIDGSPNKIYSQGLVLADLWDEAARYYDKGPPYETQMDPFEFYTEDSFGLVIDLRSAAENALHGSGLRLVDSKGGVQLEIKRKIGGSGTINCHVFVMSDAQLDLLNGQLKSIQY